MIKNKKIQEYEKGCEKSRLDFASSPLYALLATSNNKKLLHAFWIIYTSRGVHMTMQVEKWIKLAGESCIKKNFIKLGKNLMLHASQEKDHHLMMIKDCENLTDLWNTTYENDRLILKRDLYPEPIFVKPYIKLHENIISGNEPFRQIAVEYEIENLSLTQGKPLLDTSEKIFGKDFLDNLSFLYDHAALDVGHTKFNREQLNMFLTENPKELETVINSGCEALRCYEIFLNGCIIEADDLFNGMKKEIFLFKP